MKYTTEIYLNIYIGDSQEAVQINSYCVVMNPHEAQNLWNLLRHWKILREEDY